MIYRALSRLLFYLQFDAFASCFITFIAFKAVFNIRIYLLGVKLTKIVVQVLWRIFHVKICMHVLITHIIEINYMTNTPIRVSDYNDDTYRSYSDVQFFSGRTDKVDTVRLFLSLTVYKIE